MSSPLTLKRCQYNLLLWIPDRFHRRKFSRTVAKWQKAQTKSSQQNLETQHSTRRYLEEIRKFKHLNAFTFVASEKCLEEQWDAAQRLEKASLRGLPIAVKDNFCVEGMPATCGSRMLNSFEPPYTATVVEKLKNAGAVILGKTNMDEFGMGNGTVDTIYGPTKNIWGLDKHRISGSDSYSDWYVPGGSSGGSAVAVAAGICFAAIGSDTGGSTRNPASYCGVVGLKPTYGTVSRHGLIPLVNSMDVPGILTRTVGDSATLYDIIKGWDSKDSTTVKTDMSSTMPTNPTVKGMRIGVPKEFQCEGMTDEVKDCWKSMADFLSKEGAEVEEVSLPHTKYSIVCYSVLNPCEVASNMARYDGLRYGHRAVNPKQNSTEALFAQTRHEGFNVVVRGRILAGNYFLLKSNYDKYFVQAMKVRRLIQQDFKKVWRGNVHALLTPCTLTTAPKYTEFVKWDNRKQSSVQDYCTQSANLAGVPALSLPIKISKDGLPLSLQLIGPRFSEKTLFRIGSFIEKEVKFPIMGWNWK